MRISPPTPSRRSQGFTLVEIMIVVAIIAVLAVASIPGFIRARKRAQANVVRNDLRMIDSAVDQYATEYIKPTDASVPYDTLKAYFKPGTRLYESGQNIFDQTYGAQKVGTLPKVPADTYDDLLEVAPADFWAPYVRGN